MRFPVPPDRPPGAGVSFSFLVSVLTATLAQDPAADCFLRKCIGGNGPGGNTAEQDPRHFLLHVPDEAYRDPALNPEGPPLPNWLSPLPSFPTNLADAKGAPKASYLNCFHTDAAGGGKPLLTALKKECCPAMRDLGWCFVRQCLDPAAKVAPKMM